ncbi:MAG: hypothetical protein Q8P46_04285 [Hyphomicrobiales bacterium]|nr:hypothetical protein [Hyphomicrobiales bacterium]
MTRRFCRVSAILIACAGLAAPALATQEHLDTLERECGPQLGFSASGCKCISNTAAVELNDTQQAFVAAQVTKNQAEIARIQGAMTMDEMMQAANFMTTAPSRCAGR